MMTLVKNTMSGWKILKDKDGSIIEWKFIQELHELQEKEGLRLANKLRSLHVYWKPAKIKVNLAAQTLSSSVADALEYCEDKLHEMPQFNGFGPAVKYICVFDRLFDVLNSRNSRANSFKAPIRKTNYEFVKKFLDDACEYTKGLIGPDGKPILQLKRKTGFVGFFPVRQGSSWISERSRLRREPSIEVSFGLQDESGSLGVVLRRCASIWRMERQSYGNAVQVCIQATYDEAQLYWGTRDLRSSRRHRDAK